MKSYETIEIWFCDGSRTIFYGYELEDYANRFQFSASDFMNSDDLDINLYDDDGCIIGGVWAI